MVRVLAVVEGPTERNFGQEVLAPHLARRGVEYHPRVVGTAGHKGGVGRWDRALRFITGLIRQEPRATVTTMFDWYALPPDWPGRRQAIEQRLANEAAVEFVQDLIDRGVKATLDPSGPPVRFVPYLSLHEFEALLFSGPAELADVLDCRDRLDDLHAAVSESGGCERINGGAHMAPSKRIESIACRYKKTVDAVTIANRIGLDRIRTACPHFGNWLGRLEQLGEVD